MTPEDEEFNRIEREATARLNAVSAALEDHATHLKALKAMARLYIPDAIHHTDLNESLEYIRGWNDCRQAMLGGGK